MSDFFYKENIGHVFSPIINVKHEEVSPTVLSAIDNLLSPNGDMFTRAATIKKLMQIEKMSLEAAAKTLSLGTKEVAGKLRLLEFTPKERQTILEYEYSESTALVFLELDKLHRLYAMEYCHKNGYSSEQIRKYVNKEIENKKKSLPLKAVDGIRKFSVCDVGFFLNSIENALRIAKNAGFDVENERSENENEYNIHIKVKKQKKDR